MFFLFIFYLDNEGSAGSVGIWRWRKICTNLILALHQGFGELKTEQPGRHSLEQQRHPQAPIDV